MSYDVGIKDFLANGTKSKLNSILPVWLYQYMTLVVIEKIVPVVDDNLYLLYASEYKKQIQNLTEEDIHQLTTIYNHQLIDYIHDIIFDKLLKILEYWKPIIESEASQFTFLIPVNSKSAFTDFLYINKINNGTDDTLVFNKFKSTLYSNIKNNWFGENYTDVDEDKVVVSSDNIKQFFDIIYKKVDTIYKVANDRNDVAKDVTSKIKEVIDYIKTFLTLVNQEKYEYDIIDELYNKFLALTDNNLIEACKQKARSYKGLEIYHAICIFCNTNVYDKLFNINDIDDITFEKSDAFKYIVVSLATEIKILERSSKQ